MYRDLRSISPWNVITTSKLEKIYNKLMIYLSIRLVVYYCLYNFGFYTKKTVSEGLGYLFRAAP